MNKIFYDNFFRMNEVELKSNGDIYLLQKDLDSISIINKMSKNIPAYQLVYSNAKPCDIVDKITSHIINKKA